MGPPLGAADVKKLDIAKLDAQQITIAEHNISDEGDELSAAQKANSNKMESIINSKKPRCHTGSAFTHPRVATLILVSRRRRKRLVHHHRVTAKKGECMP